MCHLSWDFYCYNDDGLEPGCIVASWGAQTRFAISCSSAIGSQFLLVKERAGGAQERMTKATYHHYADRS